MRRRVTVNKFWNFVKNEGEKRKLYFNGVIAEESWYDDGITPEVFKEELNSGTGDIEIWINSPGGDCIAASRIYAMLMDYKGNITIKIDGIAASAASVIAMAGTDIQMAPTALMMIHNPFTVAIGDSEEMKKASDMLNEVKESIINAYEIKTSLDRKILSELMDSETWMNANKAVELGFADSLMKDDKRKEVVQDFIYSRKAVSNSILDRIRKNDVGETKIINLEERLHLLGR